MDPYGYSKPLRREILGIPESRGVWRTDGSSGILWQIPRPRGGVWPRDGVWEAEVCRSEVGDARPSTRWALPVPPCVVPAACARACPVCERGQACCDSVRGVLLWLLWLWLQPLIDAAASLDTSVRFACPALLLSPLPLPPMSNVPARAYSIDRSARPDQTCCCCPPFPIGSGGRRQHRIYPR